MPMNRQTQLEQLLNSVAAYMPQIRSAHHVATRLLSAVAPCDFSAAPANPTSPHIQNDPFLGLSAAPSTP
jgi:hypothetical protein